MTQTTKANPQGKIAQKALLVAGSATALAFYPTQDAEAITFIDNNPFSFSLSDGGSAGWDIDGVGGADASFNTYGSSVIDFQFNTQLDASVVGNFSNLTVGNTVDGNLSFSASVLSIVESGGTVAVGFTSGVPGFIGFQFTEDTNNTSVFGWAEVTLTAGTDPNITISEWAFNETGGPIQVGQQVGQTQPVPFEVEGVSGMMALMGAYGVYRWKKQRRAQRKAASNN